MLLSLLLPALVLSAPAVSELNELETRNADFDPAEIVNLFIGSINGGHTFPGATLPHGMIKAGMDTDSPGNHAGYDGNSTYNVTGFSQLHDTGTGGSVPLSNFKLFPFANCTPGFEGCPPNIAARKILRKVLEDGRADDFASPGYFSTNLSNGVRVELTATRRTALHRYTFPPHSWEPRLLVDITNDGKQDSSKAFMRLDETTGRVVGGATFTSSFGPGQYRAYVCADFKGEGYEWEAPTEHGAWYVTYPARGVKSFSDLYTGFLTEMGAMFTFPPNPAANSTSGGSSILARVGVSFISEKQACESAEEEVWDWDFDRVHREARGQWNDILERVKVERVDGDDDTVSLLYSSLYRTHIVPANYTGENQNWNSTEVYYDSIYCNWDTYRTLYPLMSLHDPHTFAEIVRGFIDIQKHEGWLPECRGANTQQWIQGGSHADPVLAEFFVKYHDHARNLGVSPEDLWTALLADAEKQPPNWNLQGRQVDVWNKYGYIPQNVFGKEFFEGGSNSKQCSRTVELAFDDFSISQVAKFMGLSDDSNKYAKRSQNFLNLWNPNVTVPDAPAYVQGFIQPKFSNGTFNHTDPRHCSIHDPVKATCFLNNIRRDGFYESSPIVYSQYAPHDTAKLIEIQGGPENFIQRLDWIFDEGYFDSTNEPSQQIPFMYHYAHRPALSTFRSRQTISTSYNTSLNGLPGNDDSGAMASYVFFYLVGLYPLPATQQFLLSSPYFPSISFYNPLFESWTTIKVSNFDTTGKSVYVKDVKIDGKEWKSRCWIPWSVFENGSTVELEVTDDMSLDCGAADDSLPASLSTGGYGWVNF